jgi:stage III sporulation protein AA
MEVRIRVARPVQLLTRNREITLSIIASEQDVSHLVSSFSGSSLYAFEEEMRQGFLTLPGGHRVGFAGKALLSGSVVRGVKYISSICVRVAHSIPGCMDNVLPSLFTEGIAGNTIIVSPPQAGKTTMLRDLARHMSAGVPRLKLEPRRVCIVDERSEIAGCYLGRPQLDVGPRTDVLDGYPKASGMLMALRSMSPQVLVTDEIGTSTDAEALEEAVNSGVTVLTSAHGNNYEDILRRPALQEFMRLSPFRHLLVLSNRQGPGTVEFAGSLS